MSKIQSIWLMVVAAICSALLLAYSILYVPSGRYKITLFADNGTVIKSWEATGGTMLTDSFVKFKDISGKKVRISGTIVIEDL